MSITPQEVLNAAYAKSEKNQPGRIAEEATELLGVVNRAVRSLFMMAARLNPFFYMVSANVVYSGGWARPTAADLIYRIEFTSGGAVVVTVPLDDKVAALANPAVYRLGQVYEGAGNSGDPTNEDLTFYYTKVPTDAANLSPATIDTMYPDAYKELPVLVVAIYLALKDGRVNEIPALRSELDTWVALYSAFLEHETTDVRNRWGPPRTFNVPSITSIGSLIQAPPAVAEV
jgi:hypothetical protein